MARLPVLRGNSCGKIPEHRRAASSALTAAASSYLRRALVLFLAEEPVEKRLGQPLPEDDLCPIVSLVEFDDVVLVEGVADLVIVEQFAGRAAGVPAGRRDGGRESSGPCRERAQWYNPRSVPTCSLAGDESQLGR